MAMVKKLGKVMARQQRDKLSEEVEVDETSIGGMKIGGGGAGSFDLGVYYIHKCAYLSSRISFSL